MIHNTVRWVICVVPPQSPAFWARLLAGRLVQYHSQMSKRTPRRPRPAYKIITPQQHQELVIGPRMAQALLYCGQATMAHVQTIVGLLNLVSVLVTNSHNDHLREPVFKAQQYLVQLEPDSEGHYHLDAGARQDLLSQVLDRADRLLSLQSNGVLLRALDYMERAFAGGRSSAEVVSPAALRTRPSNDANPSKDPGTAG